MRNFHLLMCSLAVYDFFHLIFDIMCFALPEFSKTYRNEFLLHMIPTIIPVTQVGGIILPFIFHERFCSNMVSRQFIQHPLIHSLMTYDTQ